MHINEKTLRDNPTLTVLFFNKGFLVTDGQQHSFTDDEEKATRFTDRYDVIETVFKLNILSGYTITDAGK